MSLLRIKELEAQLARRDERIAELERDAERYRWLREPDDPIGNRSGIFIYNNLIDLDAAIDAAMEKSDT